MKQLNSYILLILSILPAIGLAQESFKVGIIRYKSSESFFESYQPLMDFLSKELNRELHMDTIPEDELAYLLAKGEYDMGIFTPFPYLRAKLDFPELEVFASHTVNGEDSYSGCIMIRKESGIQSLHELKARNFLFVKPSSTSGYKYPKGIFTERSLDVDAGFFSYTFSGGHGRSLQALIDREVDGIAIDTRVYDAMSSHEKDSYHMLECYEIPYHAYVFSPGIDTMLKEELKQVMFEAHKNPASKGIFDNPLLIEKWHPQSDEAYNSLRRYLRIVREKPLLNINWEIKKAAQKMLDERGDLIDVLKEASENELRSTQRFKEISQQEEARENAIVLKVSLGIIDKQLHYNFYLNEEQIGEGNLEEDLLIRNLPQLLVADVLKSIGIEAQLLFNGNEWFVTYGTDDGISIEDYNFEIHGEDMKKKILSGADILKITSLNTIFQLSEDSSLKEGQRVKIVYKGDGSNKFKTGSERMGDSFWDNLDNRWGVIGLLVIAIGSYFSLRRRRRFQRLLRSCNDLLLHYIRDKKDIESPLIAQKESIHTAMNKGKVTENQFLILNKRIEDIDRLIHEVFPRNKVLESSIKRELEDICSNGVITEKEFSRINSLARKQQGLEAST